MSDPAARNAKPMTPNRMRRNPPPTDARGRKDAPRVAHVLEYFIDAILEPEPRGPAQARRAGRRDAAS